jgi:hypothetical protein
MTNKLLERQAFAGADRRRGMPHGHIGEPRGMGSRRAASSIHRPPEVGDRHAGSGFLCLSEVEKVHSSNRNLRAPQLPQAAFDMTGCKSSIVFTSRKTCKAREQ